MITKKVPLTLPEVVKLVGDSEKADKIKAFAKEFTNMKVEKAKELKEKLSSLGIVQLNEESIVNLVNFMPQDAQDVLKVLERVSLSQEDVTKILETLKE
jgi:DNA-directed RNA polymerase subunit F